MLDENMSSLTKGGNRRKPTFSKVCEWIVNAWHGITFSAIQNGFSKAGIYTYDKSIQDANPIFAAKDTAIDEGTVSQDEEMESESDKENENGLPETTADMFIDDDSEDELVGDLFDAFDELTLEDD